MNTEVVISEEARVNAVADIDAERDRQVSEEKWDDQHDDGHADGSLWRAAYFYASVATVKSKVWAFANFKQWPWSPEWFKPWKKDSTEIDQERCLIKAGALILAEQDRLDRALQKVITKLAEVQTQNKTNVP